MERFSVFRNTINGQVFIETRCSLLFTEVEITPTILIRNMGKDICCLAFRPNRIEEYIEDTGKKITFLEFIDKFIKSTSLKSYPHLSHTHPYPQMVELIAQKIDTIIRMFCEKLSYVDGIHFVKVLKNGGLNTPKLDDILTDLLAKEVNRRYRTRKAKIIQKRYRESISNPSYSMCKKRLYREWEEMIQEL